ncbi:hypothetical protein [Rahnella contaminans]|uniref:hypothetical protein n=1 Tax=Rahnella contaminans TaxID=2703882 RepID=UPI003C2C2BF0
MKLITNEYEYRSWFINDFLSLDNEPASLILSLDEIEIEIQAAFPEEFPCMVTLIPSQSLYSSGTIQYYYRKDLITIGGFLGLTLK